MNGEVLSKGFWIWAETETMGMRMNRSGFRRDRRRLGEGERRRVLIVGRDDVRGFQGCGEHLLLQFVFSSCINSNLNRRCCCVRDMDAGKHYYIVK